MMQIEEALRGVGDSLALVHTLSEAMARALPEADRPDLDRRAWAGLVKLTQRAFDDLQAVERTLPADAHTLETA